MCVGTAIAVAAAYRYDCDCERTGRDSKRQSDRTNDENRNETWRDKLLAAVRWRLLSAGSYIKGGRDRALEQDYWRAKGRVQGVHYRRWRRDSCLFFFRRATSIALRWSFQKLMRSLLSVSVYPTSIQYPALNAISALHSSEFPD